MDVSTLASLVVPLILFFLCTAVIVIITFLVFFAPKQYDPYRPDLVDIDGVGRVPADNNAASSYGRFATDERPKSLKSELTVHIVVLGDIGRSPRMQYHAISIAKHGGQVHIIGLTGKKACITARKQSRDTDSTIESEIHPELKNNPSVMVVPLSALPSMLQTKNRAAFAVIGPLKAIWQAYDLYRTLGYRVTAAKYMLVQNPPSIPVLLVAQVVCWLRNTRLIIDWHNFGWSVLALKLGRRHPLVYISHWYEHMFFFLADKHFTVSEAMRKKLVADSTRPDVLVLHDRPRDSFRILSSHERDAFLSKLPETAQYSRELLSGKWRLVVSSTSWTKDEDFSILLDALQAYSASIEQDATRSLPKIMALITGKGPMKEYYLDRIRQLNQKKQLANVLITTAWLNTKDYASLLGSADLGVSLHKSTSGVDLPMKVVDMFGAGLPVVGWSKFEAWSELVEEGVNGRGFGDARELEDLFKNLFSRGGAGVESLRAGARKERERGWDAEWDAVAGRVFGLRSKR